jgi:hypothetical protein
MNILLGDFSAKVGREDSFKLESKSSHKISIDNVVRAVKKSVKSTVLSHSNFYLTRLYFSWLDEIQTDHVLMDKRRHVRSFS